MYKLINPYKEVDWTKQQKANLHTHTKLQTIDGTRYGSDDGSNSYSEVVNLYHAKNYKILAFTDHDWGPASQVTTHPPNLFGVDPEALGMIIIEGKEFSQGHHRNSLFSNLGVFNDNVNASINEIEKRNGLGIINHPFLYDEPLLWYVSLFMLYRNTLVGLEVNNSKYEGNSIELWDLINKETLPKGKVVFGYGNDDFHNTYIPHFRNYNIILANLDEISIKNAMQNGHTYFCESFDGINAPPTIENISSDDISITITSDNGEITWITEDSEIIGTGNTFDYSSLDKLFVRAEITNEHGVTYTQPFTFTPLQKKTVEPKTLSNGEIFDLQGFIKQGGKLVEIEEISGYL